MTTPHLISIRRRGAKPLYQQIYGAFRTRILRGELRAGQEVPSTRELARDLRVSRLPVLNAYAQLHAEGYLETRVGRGTFIAASLKPPPKAATAHTREPRISVHAAALPRYESLPSALGPFQVGQPDLQSFPIDLWARLTSRQARRMRVRHLQYGDLTGSAELREVIADYLRTSRGVHCESNQILIVSGSQQALDLTTRVLLDDGDMAWVEDPGYWLVHNVLRASGVRAVPVAVDDDGLNMGAGAGKPRAVFVTPSHQYPLGVTMTAARRLQLLDYAQRNGAWIIEDDYDSEFRYDSNPIASLQGLDRNGRVIYIGSFSKVMFPSLRLGYVVVPPDLIERFTAMRQTMDLGPAFSTQTVMAAFIREGHFARHIRRMRPIYEERRRVLVRELSRHLKNATIVGDRAGMHLTVLYECDDRKIAASQSALLLSPLSTLYVGPDARTGFVLGFGNTTKSQIPAAVRQLKGLLHEVGK